MGCLKEEISFFWADLRKSGLSDMTKVRHIRREDGRCCTSLRVYGDMQYNLSSVALKSSVERLPSLEVLRLRGGDMC